jgi:hypothetical protein
MVRQDKITYLITFFQNDSDAIINDASLNLWLTDCNSSDSISQLITDGDVFPGNVINNRLLSRLGIIHTSDIQKTEALLSEFIPFTRHKFLFVNIQKMGLEICTAFSPSCVNCSLREICDFYNGKNHWAI